MKALIAQVRGWWAARAERERRILSVGGVALGLILAYLAIWEPITGLHHRRDAALADARRLAVRLETLAAESRGAQTPGRSGSRLQSLLSVVDQSGKSSSIGKAPSRIQPEGDTTVRVWLEDVSFDAVMRWLSDLRTQHGVSITDAEVERQSASGLVNVRLTLTRP